VSSRVSWKHALDAVDGDAALLVELAGTFLEESPQLISEMERALAQQDAPLLRRAAHTVKGGLRLFGADDACGCACELEEMGRAGTIDAAGPAVARLKDSLTDIQRQLSQFVAAPDLSPCS
jgi:HPt (histidine-containing phosphotransfer) domain-containing protein